VNQSFLCVNRRSAAVLGVFGALMLAGCGMNNPHPVGSYERAQTFRDAGKHREAVDAYSAFLRRSPTDSLAAEAQYDKALSYLAEKEYPLAAVELQILRQEYPTSEWVEPALFQEARAHFLEVGRIQRDVTPALEARVLFSSFVRTYPSSPLVPEAQDYLRKISDVMVRKEFGAIQVYRQLKRMEAIAITLDRLLLEEPLTTLRDEVLIRRARLARETGDPATARTMAERLLAEQPQSRFRNEAGDILEDLPAPTP
jgi:outer membrane protein assembly factor BamD